MSAQRVLRIGVIADTHGLFDPSLIKHFAGVHHADEPSISGKPLVGTAMQLPDEHIVAAGVHVKGKP